MDHDPKVSVLLPVYNAENTLTEALDSLATQTLGDFEIIAVDDGSTDHSPEILESWSRVENRLKVLHTPHAGIVGALNTGLCACHAPFVARMDADDRSLPGRLAQQLTQLLNDPHLSLVSCQVHAFPAEDVRQGLHLYLDWQNSLLEEAEIRHAIFIESPFVHPSVMFQRALVEKLGGYQDHGWPEDYDLWLRIYLAGGKFLKLPTVLFEWRESARRLTRTDTRYSSDNFLKLKAHYLVEGPLSNHQDIFIWGAGVTGRRLSKLLLLEGIHPSAYIDVDPRKIGRTLQSALILAPQQLPSAWEKATRPALIVAVGARGARPLIRAWLEQFVLQEGQDWWFCA
jgi:glycosyltransferase involved in cell wall biosynthesis